MWWEIFNLSQLSNNQGYCLFWDINLQPLKLLKKYAQHSPESRGPWTSRQVALAAGGLEIKMALFNFRRGPGVNFLVSPTTCMDSNSNISKTFIFDFDCEMHYRRQNRDIKITMAQSNLCMRKPIFRNAHARFSNTDESWDEFQEPIWRNVK